MDPITAPTPQTPPPAPTQAAPTAPSAPTTTDFFSFPQTVPPIGATSQTPLRPDSLGFFEDANQGGVFGSPEGVAPQPQQLPSPSAGGSPNAQAPPVAGAAQQTPPQSAPAPAAAPQAVPPAGLAAFLTQHGFGSFANDSEAASALQSMRATEPARIDPQQQQWQQWQLQQQASQAALLRQNQEHQRQLLEAQQAMLAAQRQPAPSIPPYDPSWIRQITSDEKGNVSVVPGADPRILGWVEHYRAEKEKRDAALLNDPEQFLTQYVPGFAEKIAKQAAEAAEQRFNAAMEQRVQQQEVAEVMRVVERFALRPDGQMTPEGQAYYQQLTEMQSIGVKSPRHLHNYACRMLGIDPFTGAPSANKPGAGQWPVNPPPASAVPQSPPPQPQAIPQPQPQAAAQPPRPPMTQDDLLAQSLLAEFRNGNVSAITGGAGYAPNAGGVSSMPQDPYASLSSRGGLSWDGLRDVFSHTLTSDLQ